MTTLEQITAIRTKMLDKDPEELKQMIEKFIPQITVQNNGNRTLNLQCEGDINQYTKTLDLVIVRWGKIVGFEFPVKMLYETYIISSSNIIIKV